MYKWVRKDAKQKQKVWRVGAVTGCRTVTEAGPFYWDPSSPSPPRVCRSPPSSSSLRHVPDDHDSTSLTTAICFCFLTFFFLLLWLSYLFHTHYIHCSNSSIYTGRFKCPKAALLTWTGTGTLSPDLPANTHGWNLESGWTVYSWYATLLNWQSVVSIMWIPGYSHANTQ